MECVSELEVMVFEEVNVTMSIQKQQVCVKTCSYYLVTMVVEEGGV